MSQPHALVIDRQPGAWVLRGRLTLHEGGALYAALAEKTAAVPRLDLGGVDALDTVGALWLLTLQRRWRADGVTVTLDGLDRDRHALLETLAEVTEAPWQEMPPPRRERLTVGLGRRVTQAVKGGYAVASLLGAVTLAAGGILLGRRRFRFNTFVRHMREAGVKAVPIVALISFLMSVVLAYQGVAQLAMFGAERFSINLVAISSLREMGGLLAAIMVAGRSGSAFTSEMGVMKLREEVDALVVTGLSPLDVMIVPRIAALVVVLPLLTVVAFVAGFFGGALVGMTHLGMDFMTYLTLFGEAAAGHNHWVGLVKAPVFALFIGLISCLAGLRVEGTAESVGRQTTRAVVQGIFAVLVLDAAFSVLFAQIGW